MLFVPRIAASLKKILIAGRTAAILRGPVPLAPEAQWPLAACVSRNNLLDENLVLGSENARRIQNAAIILGILVSPRSQKRDELERMTCRTLLVPESVPCGSALEVPRPKSCRSTKTRFMNFWGNSLCRFGIRCDRVQPSESGKRFRQPPQGIRATAGQALPRYGSTARAWSPSTNGPVSSTARRGTMRGHVQSDSTGHLGPQVSGNPIFTFLRRVHPLLSAP
jgi:hypothetical protein